MHRPTSRASKVNHGERKKVALVFGRVPIRSPIHPLRNEVSTGTARVTGLFFIKPDGDMEVVPCPTLLQVEPLAEDIATLP